MDNILNVHSFGTCLGNTERPKSHGFKGAPDTVGVGMNSRGHRAVRNMPALLSRLEKNDLSGSFPPHLETVGNKGSCLSIDMEVK